MKITTKHVGVKRDLDRLVDKPVPRIEVKFIGEDGPWKRYEVTCLDLLDLAHEVRQLSEGTAHISLG